MRDALKKRQTGPAEKTLKEVAIAGVKFFVGLRIKPPGWAWEYQCWEG